MEKTGEVRAGATPCDCCPRPAIYFVGSSARCREHCIGNYKRASGSPELPRLKSFTQPLVRGTAVTEE